MSWLSDHVLSLPPWVALTLVFAFPALEASAFVGIVFPGEITAIIGGVIASQGDLPLAAVLIAASAGAVIGDSIGYAVGRKFGRTLLARLPERFVKPEHVDRALAVINRLGGRAVLVGRCTAALRALVPGIAGMAGMRYRTFLVWNIIGGVAWATGVVMLGYLAGTGYKRLEHRIAQAGYVLLGLIVLTGFILWLLRRRRDKRAMASRPESGVSGPGSGDGVE